MVKVKLHAVAPGGLPEGHCDKEQEMICDTNIYNPCRTRYMLLHVKL
jgi:hypothetical protein